MSKLSDEKKVELSIQEKMMLTLRRTSQLQTYLEGVTIGALILLGLAIASGLFFLNVLLESGTLEALEGCDPGPYNEICDKYTFFSDVDSEIIMATLFGAYKGIMGFIIITMILVSAVGIWLYVRGKSIRNDLNRIRNDYTNQAYFFVLSTATHGKREDIALDFFDVAEDVFPELKREEVISLEKKGQEWEVEDITIVDDEKKKEKKEFRFDVVAKTKEGYFLIRYFTKDQVSPADVNETLEIADENFKTWTKGVFRLACLAKSFSNDAIKNYELLDDKKIPVDLILVREKGFSFAKIGTEKLD